jgi:protein involved in polysaccharide export with SLBB domain
MSEKARLRGHSAIRTLNFALRTVRSALIVGLSLLAGCHGPEVNITGYLMSYRGLYQPGAGIAETYAVVCPDILDVNIANHPDWCGFYPIGVDGRIDLEPLGRPRIEGQTTDEIEQQLGELASVQSSQVHVRVAEYHGLCIYLFGEVMGSQRAVPYQGQETVLELLQRTGGITQDAAPEEVYVIRPHVSDDKRPEVFHVNLRAIVLRHDNSTNLRLQPFDQVHVGATRQAGLQKCVPPWLRPFYREVSRTDR